MKYPENVHCVGNDFDWNLPQAITKLLGEESKKANNILKASWIDTELGRMIAICDDNLLYLLEFDDCRALEREIERLKVRTQSIIVYGRTSVTDRVEGELEQYFMGKVAHFSTPVYLCGSEFQKTVWHELQKISAGETKSYMDIAKAIGRPLAFRAVANANGANQLAIIIPCHRVINSNGNLGGYAGGIKRKQWLLSHEHYNYKPSLAV